MDIKILLCKEYRKQVVTVELGDDVAYWKKIAVEAFDLAKLSMILQYHDNDFHERVDGKDDFIPPDKTKFKVLTEMDEVSLEKSMPAVKNAQD